MWSYPEKRVGPQPSTVLNFQGHPNGYSQPMAEMHTVMLYGGMVLSIRAPAERGKCHCAMHLLTPKDSNTEVLKNHLTFRNLFSLIDGAPYL